MLKLIKDPSHKSLQTPGDPLLSFPDIETIREMKKLMRANRGIALAANQVGLSGRFFIADFSKGFEVVFNPEIINHGKESVTKLEGCLSVVDESGEPYYVEVNRWEVIDVEYVNLEGELIQTTFKRKDARIFQHGMCHVQGEYCLQS